jgi:hypothetical protein
MDEGVGSEHAREQLHIREEDIAIIRRTKDPNWLLRFLLGAVIGVASFVVGYSVGREMESGYPYLSLSLGSVVGAGRRRVPWVLLIVLPVFAFFCFALGTFAAHPSYGEGTYYGVFSRKA